MRSPIDTTDIDSVSRNTSQAEGDGNSTLEPLNPLQEGIFRAFDRWSRENKWSLHNGLPPDELLQDGSLLGGCLQILKTCGEQTHKWTDADFKARISAAVDNSSNGEQTLTVGARNNFIKKRAEKYHVTHEIRCLNLGGQESMHHLDALEFNRGTPPESGANEEYFPRTWGERMTDWLFSQDDNAWNDLANNIYGERAARSTYCWGNQI